MTITHNINFGRAGQNFGTYMYRDGKKRLVLGCLIPCLAYSDEFTQPRAHLVVPYLCIRCQLSKTLYALI